MNQQNIVRATPEIYVTLDLPNNQRQVIDVPTARAIYQAIGGALAAIDASLLTNRNMPATPESAVLNQPRKLGGRGIQTADESLPADHPVNPAVS